MKKELIQKLHKSFEDCAHRSEDGVEYWLARELQELLEYMQWRNFEAVIDKAKVACEGAGQTVADHFADVSKMVEIGSLTQRPVDDLALTRYACYLIAQNGDPRKDAIAFAMTYFAMQTRKQEVIETRLAEWERLQAREKLSLSQKERTQVADGPQHCSRTSARCRGCEKTGAPPEVRRKETAQAGAASGQCATRRHMMTAFSRRPSQNTGRSRQSPVGRGSGLSACSRACRCPG